MQQFGKWLVTTGHVVRNPFASLRRDLNVQADRRHVRRALTHEECLKLLTTVRTSKNRRCRMPGSDRYFVYALALATGLRRNELGSLVPEAFDLDASPPTVTVCGAWTKNRKMARLPLRRDLADEVRIWLAGKSAGQTLFPIQGVPISRMIRCDLVEAGIPFEVAGRVVDFHSLRVTFVTLLALAGVPLATAQKLARHSDPRLTANVYTHLGLADLSRAVESLPPLPAAAQVNCEPQDSRQDEPPRAAAG
jgi:integrase